MWVPTSESSSNERRRFAPVGVLAFMRITGSGRTSGLQVTDATPTANVYDLVEGKIRRVRIFMDRQEALEAVRLSE